jgi:hypothetical protein
VPLLGALVEYFNLGPFDERWQGGNLALWLDVAVDRNPFDLAPGGGTAVSLVVELVVFEGDRRLRVRNASTGTITVAKVEAHGVRCTLELHGTLTWPDGSVEPHWSSGGLNVFLLRPGLGSTNPKLTILLQANGVVGGNFTWDDSPLEVDVELLKGAGNLGDESHEPKVGYFGTVKLVQDPGVLDESNAAHKDALAAVDEVVARFPYEQPTRREAEERLFGMHATHPVDDGIVATTDWVLFQRRRTADCAVIEEPAPVTTHRYRVWAANPGSQRDVKNAIAAVRADRPSDLVNKFGFAPIDEVAFVGDSASLSSEAAVHVLQDWSNASLPNNKRLGNVIELAAIATDETDEPPTRLVGRVGAVEDAVGSAAKPKAGTTITQLGARKTLPADGADGVMVFVTSAAGVCHEVYATTNRTQFNALDENRDLRAFVGQTSTKRLGKATFAEPDGPPGGQLKKPTQVGLPVQGVKFLVLIKPEQAADRMLLTRQAKRIIGRLVPSSQPKIEIKAAETWAVDCPFASVILLSKPTAPAKPQPAEPEQPTPP